MQIIGREREKGRDGGKWTEWVNECRTCVEWAALVFSYRRRRGGVGSVAPGKLRYE